jgi:hypothetical protein
MTDVGIEKISFTLRSADQWSSGDLALKICHSTPKIWSLTIMTLIMTR